VEIIAAVANREHDDGGNDVGSGCGVTVGHGSGRGRYGAADHCGEHGHCNRDHNQLRPDFAWQSHPNSVVIFICLLGYWILKKVCKPFVFMVELTRIELATS
jgi:hypothetical protein